MYKITIHIKTLIDTLDIIANSKPDDSYRITLSGEPLIRISSGMIETINDEFVIESAEMIIGGTKANLSVNLTIKAFIARIAIGKILLLKGKKDDPFIRIEIINDQLATIEF